MSVAEKRSLNDYLEQPYNVPIKPIHDEAGSYYAARVLEFNGCIATGESFEEAHEAIYEVLEGSIEDMMEHNIT